MAGETLKEISASDLLTETLKLKNEGYRLVAISSTYKEEMELTYSFDLNYELVNLRLHIDTEAELDSISIIYPYSFLYENEIKELFGIKINGITPDYNNSLYKIPVKAPFGVQE
ncbi:NADH-quinone oxidoreductase subunit C [Lacrimispora aerotolerans]|uniref:NADH-quinone oxidoreductase subunit C n=1 Tax=Lacrimispora aerotolerans TaxID=36832 RepID=UPI00047EF29C|nr:NADH-quinone oxidoreductase subunit C [Lacrimispora aerotolerans]